MAKTIATFDTAHAGVLHDAQLDYYGKRLATASSDHSIRVWDVSSESPSYLAELRGHEGPVWQVCWAHPKFGGLLASCSYDKKVLVWKEVKANDWIVVHRCEEHTASVNGVAWSPWELGLHLACAASDGTISVLSHDSSSGGHPSISTTWTRRVFPAHPNGVNAVSWAPCSSSSSLSSAVSSAASQAGGGSSGGNSGAIGSGGVVGNMMIPIGSSTCQMGSGVGGGAGSIVSTTTSTSSSLSGPGSGSLGTGGLSPFVLVSGGCDNQVRIWRFDESTHDWHETQQMTNNPHNDWVRDVCWRPNVGLPTNIIASCSEDQTVKIWMQPMEGHLWRNQQTICFTGPVWRVSWSVTGTLLAVASGDNKVSLFKENLNGTWETVTALAGGANALATGVGGIGIHETTTVNANQDSGAGLSSLAEKSLSSSGQQHQASNHVISHTHTGASLPPVAQASTAVERLKNSTLTGGGRLTNGTSFSRPDPTPGASTGTGPSSMTNTGTSGGGGSVSNTGKSAFINGNARMTTGEGLNSGLPSGATATPPPSSVAATIPPSTHGYYHQSGTSSIAGEDGSDLSSLIAVPPRRPPTTSPPTTLPPPKSSPHTGAPPAIDSHSTGPSDHPPTMFVGGAMAPSSR